MSHLPPNPVGGAQSLSFGQITALSPPALISEARLQIDKELVNLDESMRALRSRRNTLSSISRLPPELLANVFIQYAQALCVHDQPSILFIKVGHICRHWRAVALGCPSLWSNIVFSPPRWTEEMLVRSKMAPLVIKVDLTYMTTTLVDGLQKALKHSNRVKELKLVASKETMDKLLSDVSGPATMLESLSLSNSRYSHYSADNVYPLPESLFAGHAPRLRRVELYKCGVSWDSPLFANLTHLDIHNTASSARPTISQVVSAFQRMPNLQVLSLQEALPTLPEAVNEVPHISHVVSLPALRSVHLSGRVVDCAHILAYMSYPETATLRLACRAGSSSGSSDFSSIFPAIVSNSGGGGTPEEKPLRTLKVQSLAPNSVRFQGWSSAEPSLDLASETRYYPQPEDPTPQIEVDMSCTSWGMESAQIVVQSLCSVLPLTKLRTLHIHNFSHVPETFWLNSFGGMLRLRKIVCRNIPVEGLLDALVKDIPGTGRSLRQKKTGGVFLSTVSEMVLEAIDFDDDGGMHDRLLDCLMERAERMAEIKKLSVQDCRHVFWDDVNTLEEVVVDVLWDGIEQGFEDDEEEDDEASDIYYPSFYPSFDDDIDDYELDYLGPDWHMYF